MRSILIMCAAVSLTAASLAAAEPLKWRPGFELLSGGSEGMPKLVVSVITNDVSDHQQSEEARPPWCDGALQRRFTALLQRRADLAEKLVLQTVPAGRPPILTGGSSEGQVKRAVIAFCDEQYRLLGFCVGVPNVEELHDLIEDAEEVRRMREIERVALQEQIGARASERLPRVWKAAMQQCLSSATAVPVGAEVAAQAGDGLPWAKDTSSADLGALLATRRAVADLEPVYRQDVAARFGIVDSSDNRRLAVLEQHVEARQPWCESMLPVIVGLDWSEIWRPIVDSIWQRPPFQSQPADEQLLSWFQWHGEREAVALAIADPSDRATGGVMQLVSTAQAKQEQAAWDALADSVQELPYRAVSIEQLAALLHEQDSPTIDLERPSPARYVIFRRGDPAPLVVRVGESPSKWQRQVKRLISSGSRRRSPR